MARSWAEQQDPGYDPSTYQPWEAEGPDDQYGFYGRVRGALANVPHGTPPVPEPPMPPGSDEWTPPQVAMGPTGDPGRMSRLPYDDDINAAPPELADPFETAMNRRTAHMGKMPTRNDPGIKLSRGEKIGGVVQNAVAGWVNAGRRAHVDPVDMPGVAKRRLDEATGQWQAEGRAIDSQVQTAQAIEQRKRQKDADERAKRRDEAYIKVQEAHARDYDEIKQRPQPPVNMGDRGLWDTTLNGGKGGILPGTAKAPVKTKQDIAAEERTQRIGRATEMGLKPGTTEYNAWVEKGDVMRPERPRAPRSDAAGTAAARTDARVRDHQNRQELEKLDEQEYGDPVKEVPGIHELRSKIGAKMQAHKATDSEVQQYNRLNNRLRMIYKRKLDLAAIDQTQYQAYIQGLQDDDDKRQAEEAKKAGAPAPGVSRPAAPAPPPSPSTKTRTPLETFYGKR